MALCWRKFYIPTASIFPLRYDPRVARQIRGGRGTPTPVDRCREARRASPQSPEQSDLLFAPYSALLSPILRSHTRYHLLDVLPQRRSLCSPERKTAIFFVTRVGRVGADAVSQPIKRKVRFGEDAKTSTRVACAPRKVRYIESVFVNAFRDGILVNAVLLPTLAWKHLPHRVFDRG